MAQHSLQHCRILFVNSILQGVMAELEQSGAARSCCLDCLHYVILNSSTAAVLLLGQQPNTTQQPSQLIFIRNQPLLLC